MRPCSSLPEIPSRRSAKKNRLEYSQSGSASKEALPCSMGQLRPKMHLGFAGLVPVFPGFRVFLFASGSNGFLRRSNSKYITLEITMFVVGQRLAEIFVAVDSPPSNLARGKLKFNPKQ